MVLVVQDNLPWDEMLTGVSAVSQSDLAKEPNSTQVANNLIFLDHIKGKRILQEAMKPPKNPLYFAGLVMISRHRRE